MQRAKGPREFTAGSLCECQLNIHPVEVTRRISPPVSIAPVSPSAPGLPEAVQQRAGQSAGVAPDQRSARHG